MRRPSHITSYYPVGPDNNVRITFTERFVGSSSKFYVGVEDYSMQAQEYIHRDGSAFTSWEREIAMDEAKRMFDAEAEDNNRFNTDDEVAAGNA